MKISVFTKSVYGQVKMYVAGPIAEHISNLTGKKTVAHRDIQALEAMGFTVKIYDSEVMANQVA